MHFTAELCRSVCCSLYSHLPFYHSYTLLSFIHFNTPQYCTYVLQVIFDPYRTGFEDSKTFAPPKGTIIAGRYEVTDVLGQVSVVWCSLFVVVFCYIRVCVFLVDVIFLTVKSSLILSYLILSYLILSSLLHTLSRLPSPQPSSASTC